MKLPCSPCTGSKDILSKVLYYQNEKYIATSYCTRTLG